MFCNLAQFNTEHYSTKVNINKEQLLKSLGFCSSFATAGRTPPSLHWNVHCTSLRCTANSLHCSLLHWFALHWTTLHCIVQCSAWVLPSTLDSDPAQFLTACSCSKTHCTLYTAHYRLHTAHWCLHTIHFTLLTTHCTLYTAHYWLHTAHWSLHNVQYNLFFLKLHTAHYTLLNTHCKLHTAQLNTTHTTVLLPCLVMLQRVKRTANS